MISRNIDILAVGLVLLAAVVFSSVRQNVVRVEAPWRDRVIFVPRPPVAPQAPLPRILFE